MQNLIKGKTYIVDIDGVIRDKPDFPTSLIRKSYSAEGTTGAEVVIYPVFTDDIARNLYGRIITLVEATTEPSKLKSVKDVFSKELKAWSDDVYENAYDHSQSAEEFIPDDDSKISK